MDRSLRPAVMVALRRARRLGRVPRAAGHRDPRPAARPGLRRLRPQRHRGARGRALPRRRVAGAARADRVAADRHRRARVGARQPLLHGRPLRPRVAADPLAGRRRLPPLPGARDGRRASRSCAPAPATCRRRCGSTASIAALAVTAVSAAVVFQTAFDNVSGQADRGRDHARLPAHRPAADRRGRRRAGGHGLAPRPHLGAARRRHRRVLGRRLLLPRRVACSGTLQSPAWYDIGWSLGLLLDRARLVAARGGAAARRRPTACASSPCRSGSARSAWRC